MPEYECFPLWGYINDELNNIDPDDLQISQDLKIDLDQWASKYESTYVKANPLDSSFLNDTDEKNFWEEGYALKNRLQCELGSNYEILYKFSVIYDKF